MARSVTVVAIAGLLLWSALGALFTAIAALAGVSQLMTLGLSATATFALAVGFALTAALAALGVWRAAPWTRGALVAWSIAANLWTVGFTLMMARAGHLPPLPMPVLILATLSFVAIPWLVTGYISRRILTVANGPHS